MILKYQIFLKMRPVVPSCSMRTDEQTGWRTGRDRQTDRQTDKQTDGHDVANSHFRNFANTPRQGNKTARLVRPLPLTRFKKCLHLTSNRN